MTRTHRVWFYVGLVLGCSQEPPRSERPPHPLPSSAPSTAPPWPSSAPSRYLPSAETRRSLDIQRNRTVRFGPTESEPQRLAFFGVQLARLTRSALYLIRLDPKASPLVPGPVTKLELTGPRELGRLGDNSLLVIAQSTTHVLSPEGKAGAPLGKVSYFASMLLWPDLREPQAFTTVDTTQGIWSLYRWPKPESLEADNSPIWLPMASHEQPALRRATCALLLDGSYACLGTGGLYHGFPGYPAKRLGPIEQGAPPLRLLAGKRADRVEVLRNDGQLDSYWVIPKPKRLGTLKLTTVPFDIVSHRGNYVVLSLGQSSEQSSTFELGVFGPQGATVWQQTLDSVELSLPPDEFDRRLGACRNLAIHPTEPWLAVSDCEKVRLFDLNTGAPLAQIDALPF